MAISAALLLAGLLIAPGSPWKIVCFILAYLAAGWRVLWSALRNMAGGKIFDETFLMAIASIGAMCIGDFPEGVAVMLFYDVGEFFQDLAVGRSRQGIKDLMDIRPDHANLVTEDGFTVCDAAALVPGQVILVRAGERIPLDGTVLEGTSQVDTAALTGESMPRDVTGGSAVLAGCVNLSGTLTITVVKPFGETTAAKILELVENAGDHKAPAEQFITKFARYYTPIVVGIAVLIAVIPPLFLGGVWSDYIHRALVFLVISCPCALVISVPMGFFAGIGCASQNGILVKGSSYLEALCHADTVVFDKTGTLTQGKFQLTCLTPSDISEGELLYTAAHAEVFSSHPIAQSIRAAYQGKLEEGVVKNAMEQAGGGVSACVNGREVLAGNSRLLTESGVTVPSHQTAGTAVFVAIDGQYAGVLDVGDIEKPEAKKTVSALKALGIRRTVMLTGDGQQAGDRVGASIGIDTVYGALLPDAKVQRLEQVMRENSCKGNVLYIGDGMNDAPVLARADVGVAMGGMGTDAAIEAADIVIMDDNLERLPQAIQIARHTRAIVMQNIVFALLVKVIVLTLGALGNVSVWLAVFADVGVSLLAVLNSMRALRTPGI
ncbi:MAG: heavy metal translocating P-type ATPase [Oscillospiraceae bacterium]